MSVLILMLLVKLCFSSTGRSFMQIRSGLCVRQWRWKDSIYQKYDEVIATRQRPRRNTRYQSPNRLSLDKYSYRTYCPVSLDTENRGGGREGGGSKKKGSSKLLPISIFHNHHPFLPLTDYIPSCHAASMQG